MCIGCGGGVNESGARCGAMLFEKN